MTTGAPAAVRPRLHTALAALGDPVRWQAVELLAGGERCVCDLEALLGVAQSRLSYHLGILRRAHVVRARREGRWVYYALMPETLEELSAVLGGAADEWRRRGSGAEPSHCG